LSQAVPLNMIYIKSRYHSANIANARNALELIAKSMIDHIPENREEWNILIDANPHLTDEYKFYLKAQITTKKTNNEADHDRVRDRYKIEATE
jgi:hypothetical protein